LTEYFPPNHGSCVLLAATHSPRKSTGSAARKIARTLAAFSLPQDSQVELMFGAARFGEPALSVSPSLGFHSAPRRGHSPLRLDMPRKCFNQQQILDQRDALPRRGP
jgi:hypothetical protein